MEELEKITGIMFCRWDFNCPTIEGSIMDPAWPFIQHDGKNYLRTTTRDGSTLSWYKDGGIGVVRGYSARQLPFWVVIHGAGLPPKPNPEHPSLIAGVPPMVGMVLLDVHRTAKELPQLRELTVVQSMRQLNSVLEEKYPEFQISLVMIYQSEKSKGYNCAGIARQQVVFSAVEEDQTTKSFQMHDDNLAAVFTTQVQAKSTLRLDIDLGTIRLEGDMSIPNSALRAILREGEKRRYEHLLDHDSQARKGGFFNQKNGQQATINPEEPRSCCMLL